MLNPAIASQRDTEIEYYSASRDETGKRVVEPFGLIEKKGDLIWIFLTALGLGLLALFLPLNADRLTKE